MTPEEEAALIAYLLQQAGIDPASMQLSMGSAPLEPSSDQKRGLDYRQDYNQLLADPFTGAQAGSGAFDYSAFQPTIEEEEVQREGERMLQFYRQRNEGTWERIIADELASGGTASSAFAIINAIANGEPTTAEDAEMKTVLLGSIPPKVDFTTGETLGPDMETVYKSAQELQQKVALDPIADRYDEATGKSYNQTEVPSEAAQKFRDLGLPTPDQRYDFRMLSGLGQDDATASDMTAMLMQQLVAPQEAKANASQAALQKFLLDQGQPPLGSISGGPATAVGGNNDRRPVGGGRRPRDFDREQGSYDQTPEAAAATAQLRTQTTAATGGGDGPGIARRLGDSIGDTINSGFNAIGRGAVGGANWLANDMRELGASFGIDMPGGGGPTRTPMPQGDGRDLPSPRGRAQPYYQKRADEDKAALLRSIADVNRATMGDRRAQIEAHEKAKAATAAGRSPLVDALLARRMQGYLTSR